MAGRALSEWESIRLVMWQAAARHHRLADFVPLAGRALRELLPFEQLAIQRLDPDESMWHTLCQFPAPPLQQRIAAHRKLTAAQLRGLTRWCRAQQSLSSRSRQLPKHAELILPTTSQLGLAIPLGGDPRVLGSLQLTLPETISDGDADGARTHLLAEVFSVALANDQDYHSLAAHREAAEADKGALLRRLGRAELGDTIIGEQTGLRQVMERVDLIVDSEVPVLILGETGTGKELVARALHLRGRRHDGPFIRVNCGAIPTELIDSQLFGHEQGSFTGAVQSRAGWFERADGGTLFLDEIGELPLEAQVRLLRVLQDGLIERVGGQQSLQVDVRVVAATHRDLSAMVRERRFREDLWYRLAVFPILLPPLRERRDDIKELAQYFADRAAVKFTLAPVRLEDEGVRLLQSYSWPGNIRELGAVIDRAAILGNGQELPIAAAMGWSEASPLPDSASGRASDRERVSGETPRDLSLDAAMREHIQSVLAMTAGQIEGRQGAAARLQINPHTLRARMRRLGIDWSAFRVAR